MHNPSRDPAPDTAVFDGNVLRSAFQPIFSFSHQRLVGHEALIRAHDPHGRTLSPHALFAAAADAADLDRLDRTCIALHLANYARQCEPAQWLFLNLDIGAFVSGDVERDGLTRRLLDATAAAGLQPGQIVVELLEAALPDAVRVEHLTQELKDVGFNLALDDFGAGHSNFDRVFRLQPHLVKLDRNSIEQAAADPRVRRVLAQMIALLHECGTQVLIEGVETADEATIALDADADFGQGFYFGRPEPTMRRLSQPSRELAAIWRGCDERNRLEAAATAARIAPYADALTTAARRLAEGATMADACAPFVRLPNADLCYLLDRHGVKSGPLVGHDTVGPKPASADRFAPLLDVRGSRWSRRPYFRSALAAPGQLQATRPYPTMHGPLMTVTLSLCFELEGQPVVLCGDKLWRPEIDRFGGRTDAAPGERRTTRGPHDIASPIAVVGSAARPVGATDADSAHAGDRVRQSTLAEAPRRRPGRSR